ncbi:hypothetical protein IV417_07345 [Alphaproteobacteria bacterium KMM 3653]|uniref:Uncharacterized protein n=1 Tax=Harenicola maris TaxID=2841044 RepID=A0AAP2G870_9RHOB|nr:hypothetical protein [Harenicola maris]
MTKGIFTACAIAALSTILHAAPALAAPDVYVCTLQAKDNAWVAENIVISHDAAAGRVRINDPLIQSINGRAVDGEVRQNTNRRLTLGWDLRDVEVGSQRVARFAYRLTLYRGTGKAVVTAKPLGFSNTFLGRGTCAKQGA